MSWESFLVTWLGLISCKAVANSTFCAALKAAQGTSRQWILSVKNQNIILSFTRDCFYFQLKQQHMLQTCCLRSPSKSARLKFKNKWHCQATKSIVWNVFKHLWKYEIPTKFSKVVIFWKQLQASQNTGPPRKLSLHFCLVLLPRDYKVIPI